nr:hypothetical protein [Tanacetum cinerariifolium]
EAEATEAIRLCSQVSVVEASEAARVNELNSLKEWTTALEAEKSTLEGQVATLESAAVIKDTELASSNAQIPKLTQYLSNFQLSCDELSIKAASLESKRDNLTDQRWIYFPLFIMRILSRCGSSKGRSRRNNICCWNPLRVVLPLAGGDEQGGQNDNVDVAGPHDLNEEGDNAEHENHSEVDGRVGLDDNIVVDDDVQPVVADKPKGTIKKKKAASSASGSNLPPKNLREDPGTSGNDGASTAGKSLAELQGLLDRSTLAAKVGVTAAETVPFVTSSVTLTSEHEGDVEDTSIVRSSISPPPVMTAAVAATAIAGTFSAFVLGTGTEPVIRSLFTDFASPSAAEPDTAGPSTIRRIYVPKWNVINDSALDDPELCRIMIDQLALPKSFFYEAPYLMLVNKRLKLQPHRAEAEATEAIRLCSQVSVVEASEATRVNELNSLKEWTTALEAEISTLEGQVATLESAAVIKDTELASSNAQ